MTVGSNFVFIKSLFDLLGKEVEGRRTVLEYLWLISEEEAEAEEELTLERRWKESFEPLSQRVVFEWSFQTGVVRETESILQNESRLLAVVLYGQSC